MMAILDFFEGEGHIVVCGILVPYPGIKPVPPAVEAWSPTPRTTREPLAVLKIEFSTRDCCWEMWTGRILPAVWMQE